MTPSQKLTLAVVTLAIPAAFLVMLWNGSTSSYVALSYGKVFSPDEQRNAEQSLKEAGLTQFRSEGRQILAPRGEVEKYNNALLQSGSLPSNWAEELETKLEKSTVFSTPDQLQALKDAALAKTLRRMLLAGPDFEDANVIWTPVTPRRARFGRGPRVTATVNVKPKAGRELTQSQVRSIRAAVAGMVSDLSPTDVTVFDMVTYQAYTGDKEGDPYDSGLIAWIREHTRMYEDKILSSLTYIPGVHVTVGVDVENLKRSIETNVNFDPKKSVLKYQQEQTRNETAYQAPVRAEPGVGSNAPRSLETTATNQKSREATDTNNTVLNETSSTTTQTELIAAFPKQITVAVAIPEEYYVKALEQAKAKAEASGNPAPTKTVEQLQQETETAVKAVAAAAIPNGKPEQISVNKFVSVEPEVPKVETSTIDTVTSLANEWGGTIGLTLFALWALMTLRKSLPKGAPEEPALPATTGMVLGGSPSPAPAAGAAKAPREKVVEVEESDDPTERDLLQDMVRDNPEAAAAVLSKWLQTVK